MALVGFSIVIIPALLLFALFVWSLVAILSTPDAIWKASGLNQWMWLLVVVVLPVVGSVLFLVMARGQLMAFNTGDPVERTVQP